MRHYETLVIIRPTLTESEIEEQIESIKNLINELG
ncbi:MAG: 30S ribosomal protein S6, partial [Epsilonproteobacteria bacterium]|nr:30S ribosomal protein S6 [Campylobacterota bacterium]